MNNCKFLQYPHFCIVCKSPIDMKKIERYVFDCIRYEHKPELMPPHRDNDPIIVKDYGNDVEIICGIKCAESYLFDQIQVNKNQLKQDFEFEVMLLLEEEREFNRQKMRETGYRIGVQI